MAGDIAKAREAVAAGVEGVRRSTADLLRHLARETADPRFAVAAGIIAGGAVGRPSLDDGAALRVAETLMREGNLSARKAAQAVAPFYAGTGRTITTAERLRKKLGRNNKRQAQSIAH